MHIHLIAAARPNFMKIAPLYHVLKKQSWAQTLIVHTGQHYDLNMSDAFFEDLGLPEPDIHLGVGSGSHAEQTGRVMIAYEKILLETQPDLVIVVGDVNSTLACTMATSKISYNSNATNQPMPRAHRPSSASILERIDPRAGHRPVIAHLEAGLRSFDRSMPEEINRLVTDALSDILWTPSRDADENLVKEGIAPEKIKFVGNIMIDSLELLRDKIKSQAVYEEFPVKRGKYGLVTLHRPSNVDDKRLLEDICRNLVRISEKIPIIFPIHPRTLKNLKQNGLMNILNNAPELHPVEPLSYIRFMNLLFNCLFGITDSGGIQEETTYLGIPCLTMRPNTERPITVHQGTNHLCRPEDLVSRVEGILRSDVRRGQVPEFWDGHTASRVLDSIKSFLITP